MRYIRIMKSSLRERINSGLLLLMWKAAKAMIVQAAEEAKLMDHYDYIVVNDQLDDCVREIDSIICCEGRKSSNQKELIHLIRRVREELPDRNIWMYTGFLWESIKDLEIMNYIDVLVDGEFEVDKKDVQLFWRGSANQRVIDVPKTKESGEVVLHCE